MAGIDKGTVFGGRYIVQSQVGIGGMATVYRGVDNVLDRAVAIKVMLPQYANDPAFAQRFKQEAQAAAALQNPYIVSVYDWGRDDATGTYYIVMEYLRGTDLKTGIRSHGALAPRKVAQIGAQVCSALAVAHAHGIIHRDIKPQNIMIQPNGDAKVMDFGIARAKNSHLTQTNSVLGTAHYVSPEQAQGKELGPTSDLYSLGVVMYEASTGKLPFDGEDAVSVALKQVNEYAVPPSQVNPNVDDTLEAIIMRCMAKDPDDRFQTADELRHVLNAYISGQPVAVQPLPPQGLRAGGAAGTTSVLRGETAPTAALRPGQGGAQRMARDTERLGGPSSAAAGMNRYSLGGAGGSGNGGSGGRRGGSGGREARESSSSGGVKAGVVAGIAIAVIAAIVAAVLALNSCSRDQDDGDAAEQQGSAATTTTTEAEAETEDIPDVSGLTQQEATSRLTAAGFKAGGITQENSATVASGSVIRTIPAAGTSAAKGSTVSLVVSKGAGTAELPTLTKGMSEADLVAALKAAGFTPEHDATLDDYDSDTVSPAAEGTFLKLDPTVQNATSVERGATVKYGLSKGPATVTVPTGFYNVSEATARAMLEAAGITPYVDDNSYRYDDTVPAGNVIGIDEQEGGTLTLNSSGTAYVTLYISRGPQPVTVQDYTGWSVSSTQQGLANQGLVAGSVDTSVPAPSEGQAGLVYATSPSAGSQAAKGSTVSIYAYGSYVDPGVAVPESIASESVADAVATLEGLGLSVTVSDGTYAVSSDAYGDYVITSVDYAGGTAPTGANVTVHVTLRASSSDSSSGSASGE